MNKWLCKNGMLTTIKLTPFIDYTTDCVDLAAEHGHLEIIKYLHEVHSLGCSVEAMNSAACNGHFDVVVWLSDHEISKDTMQSLYLLERKDLIDLVDYIGRNEIINCKRTASICAFNNNHMDIYNYLNLG